MVGKLESSVKGYLAIGHFLSVQGTFRLHCGFNAISEYDVDAIMGVPMGGCQQWEQLDWRGDVVRKGLWEELWLGLWWQCDCLPRDQLEWHPLCLLVLLWGSGYLFMDCCSVVAVSCFSAYTGQ